MQEPIVLPRGFQAAGVAARVKKSGARDMALFYSEVPAAFAGVFTTNQVAAAPVKLCRERLEGGTARAIVANSGNANAATGPAGLDDARRMAALTATALGVPADQVLVCSTGRIGARLPMDKIEAGIRQLPAALAPDGGAAAAEAIMTTDTFMKTHTVRLVVDGRPVIVTGVAKGAGMIEPHMATMFAFLLTDAVVPQQVLQFYLTAIVNQSFNRISVDGDMSTNDTVLCLANGQAGNDPLTPAHPQWSEFYNALAAVALDLAKKIVRDGEGATKFVTVQVRGARDHAEADAAARAVANSLLIKTSWAGSFAIWGRVLDALGYSPARVQEDLVDVDYDDVPAARHGVAAGTPAADLDRVVAQKEFRISIDLHLGPGTATVYTCNCTEEYVRINME